MNSRPLSEFESECNITFASKALLREAFVHSSYANEAGPDEGELSDNERLEFLGDAVLEFVVSNYLYERFPQHKEGGLTRLRAALVRRETLAHVALNRRLGEFLVLGRGEEDSGGRNRPAILCATYEAIVGAIFLDQGLQVVEDFILPDLERELEAVQNRALGKDAKSRLQEWSQLEFGVTPRYHVVEMSGPDHAKSFVIEVKILGTRCGVGVGNSKQVASQAAATYALCILGRGGREDREAVDALANWSVDDDVREQLYDAAVSGK